MDNQCTAAVNRPEWLTVAEFAEATCISKPTIWRLAAQGKIARSKLEGSVRIHRSELEHFERGEIKQMS